MRRKCFRSRILLLLPVLLLAHKNELEAGEFNAGDRVVLTARTELMEDDTPIFELAAGARLQVVQVQGARVYVQVKSGYLVYTGWLPETELAKDTNNGANETDGRTLNGSTANTDPGKRVKNDFHELFLEYVTLRNEERFIEALDTAQRLRKAADSVPMLEDPLTLEELDPLTLEELLTTPSPGLAVAIAASALGDIYAIQGEYSDAVVHLKESLEMYEKTAGKDSKEATSVVPQLAEVYMALGRYADALAIIQGAAKAIQRDSLNDDQRVDNEIALAVFYVYAKLLLTLERYADAEEVLRPMGADLESRFKELKPEAGENGRWTVGVQQHMFPRALLHAMCCRLEGRYGDAEAVLTGQIRILDMLDGARIHRAAALRELGALYGELGRYAEAESVLKRALSLQERLFGRTHPETVATCLELGEIQFEQYRVGDAFISLRPAGEMVKRTDSHTNVAALRFLELGARMWCLVGRPDDAERTLIVHNTGAELILGAESERLATGLILLGRIYWSKGRVDEAESVVQRALTIEKDILGVKHPKVQQTLCLLGFLRAFQGRYNEAVMILGPISADANAWAATRYNANMVLAQLGWRAGYREDAIGHLRHAMSERETIGANGSGPSYERSQYLELFDDPFEQMVAWQNELGSVKDAFEAIERSRARSLQDEMELHGVEYLQDLPSDEATRLKVRERQALERVAVLNGQVRLALSNTHLTRKERDERTASLYSELTTAQKDCVQAHADICNSSPAYRRVSSGNHQPVDLTVLEQWVADRDTLVLDYLIGTEGGYVLAVGRNGSDLYSLSMDAAAASALNAEPGPLNSHELNGILSKEGNRGVLASLRECDTADKAKAVATQLNVLWELLIPEAERNDLLDGRYRRLVVIPDGSLGLLPFETLVVSPGDNPRYLLDAGPSVLYGPSATILYNLAERAKSDRPEGREPLLTVGNPYYGKQDDQGEVASGSIVDLFTAHSRYRSAVGRLTPLPNSGLESQWVADTYRKAGMKFVRLEGLDATESRVCAEVPGRRVVHLACHGFADDSYGNFFGALGLTAGPSSNDPSNDGYLTLSEIYRLNFKDCELAILSACETNYGPQQRGEGVWSLSRGFLVAGSRRVVASNWLVDDEAAASMISYFCSAIAQAEKDGKTPDYSQALCDAKRWVRQEKKWGSPYYWGPFVLVGPN